MDQTSTWKPRFFAIWTGQAFSLLGSRIARFALIWYLTESTGSATTLTTASLASVLPGILLGPFIGPLVDRWRRRWIMVVADSAIAILTLALIALFARGVVQVWHIYVVMALRAVGTAFHQPSMTASASLMVPDKKLTRVAGMNQTLQGINSVAAPPLAAAALAMFPIEAVLAIDIVTALLAVAPLLFIDVPDPARRPESEMANVQSYWGQMREGLRYLRSQQALLVIALGTSALTFFHSPKVALQTLFIAQRFGGGAAEFAMATSLYGVGSILGGVLLGAWGGFRRRSDTMLFGMAAFALAALVQYLAPPGALWVFLVGMFLVGPSYALYGGTLVALLQITVPKEKQGRVFALVGPSGSLILSMAPLGLVVLGPIADVIGIRSIYAMEVIAFVVVIATFATTPAVRHMGEESPAAEAVPAG